MKKVYPIAIAAILGSTLLFFGGGFVRPFHTSTSYDLSIFRPVDEEENPGENWMFTQRAYPVGAIPPDARYRAKRHIKKHFLSLRSGEMAKQIGPRNIGGRITDIEILDDTDTSIYLGTASGGVFLSKDMGGHWRPIFDKTLTLAIGDIAIAPSNSKRIYVGTGEPNGGGGSIAYEGSGVFTSQDGGETWKRAGLRRSGSIGQIAVDPRDENRLFAAAMGPLYRKGEQRGLYRSEDAGKSWERLLYVNDSTGIIQVLIDPLHPDTMYAVAWERFKTTTRRDYGGPASGIYKSTDGGDHWDKLMQDLPDEPGGFNRISIAISPQKTNILYALFLDRVGHLYGLYRSEDYGEHWKQLQRWRQGGPSYGYWFGGLRVSPDDPDLLYYLGFFFMHSVDGGISWNSNESIHVDQHAMAFFPGRKGSFLVGNDGGLYLTDNGGKSFTHYKNLPITQYYKIHVDASDENRIYCGAQDNNTTRTINGSSDHFSFLLGGDGFKATVHPTRPNRIYAEYQYGNLFRSDDDGKNFARVITGLEGREPYNWNFPYVLSPQHPDTMYCGSNRIYMSENGGDLWVPISPRLTRRNYSGNQTFGTVTTIDVSRLDDQLIYAGTDDGKVWGSRDQGENWTDLSAGLPNRWVTKVLASRRHSSWVWVAFSGYRHGPNDGHVFLSKDYGETWQNVTGNLADMPVNDLEEDAGGRIYAATDMGLYMNSVEMPALTWSVFGDNLLPMIVMDLQYYPPHFLYAGTYGRSGYRIKTPPPLSSKTPDSVFALWDIRTVHVRPGVLELQLQGQNMPRNLKARILDLNGQALTEFSLSKPKTDTKYRTPLPSLPAGMYWFTVRGNNEIRSRKFVLTR